MIEAITLKEFRELTKDLEPDLKLGINRGEGNIRTVKMVQVSFVECLDTKELEHMITLST